MVVEEGDQVSETRAFGILQAGSPGEGSALEDSDATSAARLFKALADPVRVQLINLIRQSGTDEASFYELAEHFDTPQATLSHHLRVLVDAGVLTRDRRGTSSWYRVRTEPLALMEALLRPGGPLRDAD